MSSPPGPPGPSGPLGPPGLPDIATLTLAYEHIYALKYYFVACAVVLFYDIGVTFDMEVEYIWKQKWGSFTLLWACLRYVPPLMEIVVLDALFDPSWTPAAFVAIFFCLTGIQRSPCSYSLVCVGLVQCVFALRTYAVFGGRRSVLVAFVLFFAGEITFMAFFIAHTTLLPDPPGVTGCAGGGAFGSRGAAAFWAPSFIFDIIIFAMTLYKSYVTFKGSRSLGFIGILLRDGSLYFCVVVFINLINMMTLVLAPIDLMTVHANLATTLPVVMASRLILNLKYSRAALTDSYASGSAYAGVGTMSFSSNPVARSSMTSKWSFGAIVDVLGNSKLGSSTMSETDTVVF
ncbi:hypothetical protein C8R44DRAFT_889899 [Mycena epipterygia]|nr:hypothetical protein C8R44DRAFT_889899 [Mycena epipterygia]